MFQGQKSRLLLQDAVECLCSYLTGFIDAVSLRQTAVQGRCITGDAQRVGSRNIFGKLYHVFLL